MVNSLSRGDPGSGSKGERRRSIPVDGEAGRFNMGIMGGVMDFGGRSAEIS